MSEQMNDYIELGGMVTDQDAQAWDGSVNFPDPGEYLFEVVGCDKGQSRKGTPQVEITFEVADGEATGKRMKGWYALTERAIGRLCAVLNACGVRLDERGGFSTQAVIGARLIATVAENTYTVTDPVTQEPITKTNVKLMGEKALPKAPPAKKGSPSARVQGR